MRMLPALAAIALSVTVGCGSSDADGRAADTELLVFAAASLTDAFAAMEEAFEADRPGIDVVVHTAGSQRLAAQILEGAPAGVFASADTAQMDRVVGSGETAGTPAVFARNRLAVAVAPGNPHGLTGPADLGRDDLTVVLADASVPLGAYTRELLARLDVEVAPASFELDARAVLGRVAIGEADAGIVYGSDLVGRTDVAAVPVGEPANVAARYPVVVLDGAGPAGRAFVEFVLSEQGGAILRDAGFDAP